MENGKHTLKKKKKIEKHELKNIKKYEEVLVSAVAILGSMLSVPGKVFGLSGEGSDQHAKSEAPVACGMKSGPPRRQGLPRRWAVRRRKGRRPAAGGLF